MKTNTRKKQNQMEYLKKDGTLVSKAVELINSLRNGKYRKLSDFYSSRSTNYPSILNSDLFVISSNKTDIANSGFAPTTKNVVKINTKNKYVAKAIKEIEAKQKAAEKAEKEAEKKFSEMVKSARIFIKENKELVDNIKSKHNGNSKGLQQVAWKLSNRAVDKGLNITKTAFFNAL